MNTFRVAFLSSAAGLFLTTTGFAQTPPAPVAYYTLNQTLSDSSGHNYTGTVVGGTASYTTGIFGQDAFSFSGSDYIATTTVDNLGIYTPSGGSFTVDAWVNFSSFASSNNGSVAVFGTSPGGTNLGLQMLERGDQAFLGFYGNDLGSGGPSLALNTWYNIAWTYNATGGVQSIYVGTSAANITSVASGSGHGAFAGTGETANIGESCCGTDMEGLIQDVAIYNSALTQSQIQTIANPVTPVTWTGLSGSGGSATWINGSDNNWKATAGGAATYSDGASVTFDDTGTSTNISIPSPGVDPSGVIFNNNSLTYSFTNSGGSGIGGGASLVLNGTGVVNLNSPNTYFGGTTVNAGTLNVGDNAATGTGRVTLTAGNVNFLTAAPAIGSLAGTGGTVTLGNSTGSVNTTLTIGSDGTTSTYSGTVGQASSTVDSLAIVGGSLTLSGTNSYSGGTTVSGGTLVGNAAGALGTGNVLVDGGTLRGSFANALSGAGQSLTITSGTATLGQSNSFGGGVTLSGGTLNVNNSGGLGSGSLALNGGTLDNTSGSPIVVSGSSATSINSNFTFNGTNNLDLGAAPVTLSIAPTITVSGSTLTLSGNIGSTSFGITKAGPGTLNLTGNNLYSGGTTINAGTVSATGTGVGTGIVNIGLSGNFNLLGGVQGLIGSYNQNPDGSLSNGGNANFATLTALNAYSAANVPLVVANTTASAVNSGANFDFGTGGQGFPAVFQGGGTYGNQEFQGIYRGYIYIAAAGTYTFGVNSDDGAVIYVNGGGNINGASVGQPTVNHNQSSGDNSNGTAQVTDQYTFSAPGYYPIVAAYDQYGGGLGYQNFFAAGTTSNPGLMSNSILYTSPPVATTVAGLSGSGAVNLTGLSALQIGTSSTPSSFGGSFTGSSIDTVAITGGTTLTLTGSSLSTFVSPITVSNGTLRIANSSGSATGGAPIFVGDGTGAYPAYLSGTGSTAGAVTVNGPGTGSNPGTIVGSSGSVLSLTGGLTLQSGSQSSFNLVSPNGVSNGATTALISTSGGSGGSLVINTGSSGNSMLGFSFAGTPQAGDYGLFYYTGTAPNLGDVTINPASITALTNSGYSYQLVENPGPQEIELIVTSPPVFWSGVVNTGMPPVGVWDTGITQNWANGTTGQSAYFSSNGSVTFADTYPTNGIGGTANVATGNVQIVTGGVSPITVGFTNNTTTYTLTDQEGINGAGISGSAAISLSGAGTVIFMDNNSFNGPVSISAGQLNIQSSGALGTSSGVAVSSGAALQLQGGISVGSIPLSINGAGLAASPAGALQSVSGANSFGGAISTGAGAVITSSNPGDTLTLTGGITNNGNLLTINGGGNTTVNTGAITGTGGSIYTGSGVLTLSAPSTYSGGTTLPGGTIRVGASSTASSGALVSGALGTGLVTLNGGTLQDNGSAITLGNSVSLNGSVTLSSSGSGSLIFDGTGLSTPATFSIDGASSLTVNNATTINDVISGSANLTFGGTGTLILGGSNSYSYGTTINSGVVQLNSTNALQNSVVTLDSPGGLTFNTNIGSVALGGLQDGSSAPINLVMNDLGTNPVALILGNSNSVGSTNASYSGNLTGGTTLSKVGTNTQTLTGTNSFTGVTITNGTLRVGANSLGTAPITLSGGTLAIGFLTDAGNLVDRWTFAGNANDSVGTTNGVLSGGATVTSTGGEFGNGYVSLNGTGASVTMGALPSMTSGTQARTISAWVEQTATPAGGFASNSFGFFPATSVKSSGFYFDNNGGIVFTEYYDDSGVVLSNANANNSWHLLTATWDGNTNDNVQIYVDGSLATTLSSSSNGGSNILNEFGLDLDRTQFQGNEDDVRVYNAALTPTQVASIYNGGVGDTTSGGVNIMSNTVNVTGSAIINIAGSSAVTMGALTINGSTLTVNGTGAGTLTVGATTLSGSPTFNIPTTAGQGAATLILGPLNDNSSPQSITLTGGGNLTLNSPATSLVSGTMINISNGTLNSNAAGALGSFAQVSVQGPGTFNVGASQTISSLSGPGAVTLGNNTLTIGNSDNITPAGSFAGVVSDSGSGSVVKNGTGTLTLTGANTYQGGTTINAGTVRVGSNTALGAGTVTLAGGALQFVPVATTGSIGVHFGTDSNSAATLASSTSAGVAPYAMTNWNNTAGANGTVANLTNNLGVPTATSVTWSAGGTQHANLPNPFDGDTQLMATFLNSNGSTANSVTISNIPYSSYEVITYIGAEAQNGRTASVTVGSTPTFYFQTDNANNDPYTYVQLMNNDSTMFPGGNYTLTPGQNAGSLTVTEINNVGSNQSYSGIMGVEIVNTAPPVSSESLANTIVVTQDSSMQLNGTASDSVGPLSIGGSTLSVSGTSTGANVPYTLTAGATTLTGNPTFDVANNGSGTGTLILGSLYDNGTARTVTFTDTTDLTAPGGAVTLGSAATSLVQDTIINVNGTATLNSNNATALGSYATVNVAGSATFNVGASQTVSALNGAGTVNLGANTLTIGSTDNLSSSFSGSIGDGGSGGSVIVNTTGAVTFSGASTYSGATTISGGTLVLSGASASLGNTAITVSPGTTLAVQPAASGTVRAGLTSVTGAGASLNLGSGTLDMSTGTSSLGTFVVQQEGTYSGPLFSTNGATLKFNLSSAGADELLLSGPGSVSVFGTNTISLTTIGSSLTPGQQDTLISSPNGGLTGTFDFSNKTTSEFVMVGSSMYRLGLTNSSTAETLTVGLNVSSTWLPTAASRPSYNWSNSANWSGGNVPQATSDSATFGTMTNNNETVTVDHSGISVGFLTFNNSTSNVTGTGVYTIAPDGSNDPLTLDNGGATATATVVNATNNNIISAPLHFNSIITADVFAGTSLTLSGALTSSSNTPLNVNPDAGNTGTLIISASNSSLSSPINLSGGTLRFSNGSLGSGNITFTGSSTLQYAAGNSQDVSRYIQPIGSGIVATIDTNGNTNVTFNTGLSGLGGLTKAGAGMLTLSASATNSYQGATTVSAGSLQVNGGLTSTSSVTVGANGTLGGSGTINSSVSTVSGGQISPSFGLGSPAATLNITNINGSSGNLTLADGSVLDYYLSNPNFTGGFDQVVLSGNLALLGGGTVNVTGSPIAGTYDLINFPTGTSTGSISGWSVNAANDSLSLVAHQLDLIVGTSSGTATWTSTGNGGTTSDYGTAANWSPQTVPNGAGLAATFGSGGESSVSIIGGYTIGQLNFNNGGNSGPSTNYTLSGTGSLTLDNTGGGASVNVSSGGLQPELGVSLTLTLADSSLTTTFNIAGDGSLEVAGPINQSGGNQQIVLAGGGTLQLDNGGNSYSGGTTVNSGTLIVDPASGSVTPLGSGPLAINGSTSIVNVNPQMPATVAVGSLSGTGAGQLNVGGNATLTVNQTTTSTFNGTLTLNGGLVLAATTGNTLTISGAPTLGYGSSITVNSGTLALTNNTNSTANVTGPVTASVASNATLQLAGSSNVLSSAVNITTHGSGLSTDGILSVVGVSTQTVGVISGDPVLTSPVTTYAGTTTVGDGTNAANLTATQILQNTLAINAGSTVTLAPSGSDIPMDEVATAATSSVATSDSTAESDSSSDPFTAIEAAIASGSISSAKGEQLENRIAAIERLAATDPGLDVSLLEDRVLAALPAPSVWSSSGTSPLIDSGSGLAAMDSGSSGSLSASSLGGSAAFAPAVNFGGSPAAVPEPSTLLLAILGGGGILIALRRRTIYCE